MEVNDIIKILSLKFFDCFIQVIIKQMNLVNIRIRRNKSAEFFLNKIVYPGFFNLLFQASDYRRS